MKTFIAWLIIALATQTCLAQKSPIKFGDISLEDLKMKSYDKDTSAAAVILTDYGEAYVNVSANSAMLVYERHVRIKILKKEGLQWADAMVPLYYAGSDEERVSKLKAVTYNLVNDKVVETPMSKDGTFKEKFSRNYNLLKFTLPNVKEGSIIEYTYTVSSEFLANFPNWQFQYSIPVRWSEYWAMFPEFFFFEKYMQGYLAPATYEVKNKSNTDFQVKAHHWISKDVPAFKAEPYMTCEDDYVSKINLALSYIQFPMQPVREIMGSWAKLNESLLESEYFGRVIKGSGFLKKPAEEVTAGLTDPLQKVNAIYNYVKDNLEWTEEEDKYADNLKKAFEVKKGTAADINLAFAAMLEKINIPVEPILLSTRDHGFIRQQYPMERQLNYVICGVTIGDAYYFVDATERYLPFGVLPERCLNGQGLVISKDRHRWVNIETKTKARTIVNSDLTLSEAGMLTGKVTYSCDGYDALKLRKAYIKNGEEDYIKQFLTDKQWDIEKSEFQNMKQINEAVKQTHNLSINDHALVAGDVIYINPFVTQQTKENVFKLETREYPVDFGCPLEKMYMCRLSIPEGYEVDEMPKPRVIVLPNGTAKYTYTITQQGNMLNIVSIFQLNKSLFVQTEYAHLREFYNQLVAKQAEQIVLKKKKI